MSDKPNNYTAMQYARDVEKNIFENITLMPEDFDMYPFLNASYASLCVGCTDPRAFNYDSTAEIDNNSCL